MNKPITNETIIWSKDYFGKNIKTTYFVTISETESGGTRREIRTKREEFPADPKDYWYYDISCTVPGPLSTHTYTECISVPTGSSYDAVCREIQKELDEYHPRCAFSNVRRC